MFDRLQVRGRLLLSFIGVSSFAFIAAAVAIYSFLETGKGLDSITQRWVPSALASQELSRQTERIVALAPALLAVTTAEQHDAISGDIAAEVGQFDELLLKVNARGSDPAHAVSIERNAEIIGDNLETLDGLVADNLAAAARIQDLLGKLANANMGAQRLLTPGIRALDGEVAQLRRILADPELSAAERPARVAALAQSIAATAPLRRTQN